MSYAVGYLEHLTEGDLALVARTAGLEPKEVRARLAADPASVDELLSQPALYDALFADPAVDLRASVSPFLAFGVLVAKARRDLAGASHLVEWAGPGRRLPVFDVEGVRSFLSAPGRRFFLVELLASFTRISSGRVWVRTRRGYRWRRFSELDPVRLVEVVEAMGLAQRPGGYRRLGDVLLFLAGLFPDHTARYPLSAFDQVRLLRSAGIDATTFSLTAGELAVHDLLAAAFYRRAVETAVAWVGAAPSVLLDVADNVVYARRILNYLADRYLHHHEWWLGRPA